MTFSSSDKDSSFIFLGMFFRVLSDEEIIKAHRKIIRRNKWMTVFYVSCTVISIVALLCWGLLIKLILGLLGELDLGEKDKNLIIIAFGIGAAIASAVFYMVSCVPSTIQSLQGNPESKLLLKYHDQLVELGEIEDAVGQDGLRR